MVLYAIYFLIVFVSLTCHKHHISWLGKNGRCAYSLLAVGNFDYFTLELIVKPLFHIAKDIFGVLVARVVRCEYYPFAS